jgi:hypothetical protein
LLNYSLKLFSKYWQLPIWLKVNLSNNNNNNSTMSVSNRLKCHCGCQMLALIETTTIAKTTTITTKDAVPG